MTFTKPVALALSAVLALSLSACGHKDATIEGLNDSPSPSPVVSTTVSPSPSLSSTPSPSTDAEGADEGTAAPTGEDDASAKPLPDREDNSGAKGQSVTDGHLRDGGWSDWDVQKAYRTADADEAFGAQGVSYGISDALDAMTLLFSSGDVWLPGDRKVEDFSLASTVMTPAYAKTFKGIVKRQSRVMSTHRASFGFSFRRHASRVMWGSTPLRGSPRWTRALPERLTLL